MLKKLSCILLLLMSMGFVGAERVLGQTHAPYVVKTDPKTPFRYVIVKGVSEVQQLNADATDGEDMVILMEDRSFNEKNLTKLFALLRARYPNRFLYAEVYTTLDAILTPEEADQLVMNGPIDNYRKFKYAFYILNGFGEWFRYGQPGQKEKEVTLSTPEEVKAKIKY